MFKNVASQKIVFIAYDATTGVPKTGDSANITAYVSKDAGTVTVLADTSATELDATNAKGAYVFDVAQGESNGDMLLFSAKSSTANIYLDPVIVFTAPPNFNAQSIDGNGRVDVIKIAGTTQTARDIGASVLISSGTGTGQIDFTSGVVKANLAQILGTALTETAGQIAAGFKKVFDVASPVFTAASINQSGDNYTRIGAPAGASVSADVAAAKADTAAIKTKTDFLPSATAGAAGGVFIAGTNAATTVTTALTTTFTGNLTGSVGSVTGAVGSVTSGVTITTNNDKTGYALSAAAVQAIWDALTSALTTAGSIGKLIVDNLNATISSRMATYTQPTGFLAATFPSGTLANTTNITAGIITTTSNLTNAPTAGDFTAAMKTSLNAATPAVTVSDKTGFSLTSAYDPAKTAAQAGDAMALTSGERTSAADALLNRDMSAVSDTNSRSPLNALRFLRNKWAVSGTTLTVRKEDDTASAWTGTITQDAAAIPITALDPA